MSKTILIVEDENVLRESLAELLAEEGHVVKQAANGRVAYDLILQEPVDVVLSDVRMPEMDGLTLLGHLRQIVPQTPVIIITAYGAIESAVAAVRAGAFDYLLKPVKFDDVLIRVQRALEFGDVSRTNQV